MPGDGRAATVETAALVVGGPALYLSGNALFTWSVCEYIPWSRIVAIAALGALIPVAAVSSLLVSQSARPASSRRLPCGTRCSSVG